MCSSQFKFSMEDNLVAGLPAKIHMTVLDSCGNVWTGRSECEDLRFRECQIGFSLTLSENTYIINFMPQMSGTLEITPLFHDRPITLSRQQFAVWKETIRLQHTEDPVAVREGLTVLALALDDGRATSMWRILGTDWSRSWAGTGSFCMSLWWQWVGRESSTCDVALGTDQRTHSFVQQLASDQQSIDRGYCRHLFIEWNSLTQGWVLNIFTSMYTHCQF